MNSIVFVPFPTKKKKNPKLRQKWIEMISRPLDYEPLPHHRVCSRHFIDDHDVSELFQWNNYRIFTPKRSTSSIEKRKADSDITMKSVPSVTDHVDCEPNGEQSELSVVEGFCFVMPPY
jgi:hypothetical protein